MKYKVRKKNIIGVSLVELMVSMAISLIMMAGIINFYIGSKQTYNVREDFGVLQELGRQVLETVTESVQMADHWGGLASTEISSGTVGTISGVGSCNSAWILDTSQQPVFGLDGATTQGGVTTIGSCMPTNSYLVGSDVLVLRYADGAAVTDASANSTSSPAAANLMVRVESEKQGVIFSNQNNAVTNTGIATAAADARKARNHLYKVEVYYLQNCSNAACDDGIPTLSRLTMNGLAFQSEQLADGVEQLQFQYGIDSDNDTVVDQFVNAGGVTDWGQVVSVSIDMVIRTPNQDISTSDTSSYTLAGGSAAGGVTFTPATNAQSYYRKQVKKLIQIRNRVRA